MSKPRVLYVCHNHPQVRPGGAEAYALELYGAMKDAGEFQPVLLAKTGPPLSGARPHNGTAFGSVSPEEEGEYFLYADCSRWRPFFGTMDDKELYIRHFRDFLSAYQPDVIHFHHTLFLGYDMIQECRNTLPGRPIVYTLHEYLPICHRNGQMVRTRNRELCLEASPRRCHECFPEISPKEFFLRKKFIQSHFSSVDLFLAPSRFLLERYVAWGIPRERIRFEDYGRLSIPLRDSPSSDRPRNRFGYFGQFTEFKGADVLLRAMKRLAELECRKPSSQNGEPVRGLRSSESRLWLHGANLKMQSGKFQEEFNRLLEDAGESVVYAGRYSRETLPALMAGIDWVVVPSIWWENSPLVIQEAFLCGRPVICSDIGGMAEKVRHSVNGLHFRAGDDVDLAETMRKAASTDGLWERLRAGIPRIYPMKVHVKAVSEIYQGLLNRNPNAGRDEHDEAGKWS